MNYLNISKSFLKEFTSFKSYKQLPILLRILCAIALFPGFIIFGLLLLSYIIILFFFMGLSSPIDYLEKYLDQRSNKEKLYHATQFIVYWIAFPLIFSLNVLLAFCTINLYFIFAGLQIVGYVISLGGITFQPFIFEYKEEVANKKNVQERNRIFTFVFAILSIIFIVFTNVFLFLEEYEGAFFTFLIGVCLITPVLACFTFKSQIEEEIVEEINE